MSAGEIIEKGNPRKLMENKNSAFFSMAKDAGLVKEKNSSSRDSQGGAV